MSYLVLLSLDNGLLILNKVDFLIGVFGRGDNDLFRIKDEDGIVRIFIFGRLTTTYGSGNDNSHHPHHAEYDTDTTTENKGYSATLPGAEGHEGMVDTTEERSMEMTMLTDTHPSRSNANYIRWFEWCGRHDCRSEIFRAPIGEEWENLKLVVMVIVCISWEYVGSWKRRAFEFNRGESKSLSKFV
jgi:hypothetical protein